MTILADTTVWVDHWRRGNRALARQLAAGRVLVHPFVIGELSLGALHPRAPVLENLRPLHCARLAEPEEVDGLVERRRLLGRGIGWVDVHLLASALLEPCRLWTLDRRLALAAEHLGVAWSPARPRS